jgi:hypothetical protein
VAPRRSRARPNGTGLDGAPARCCADHVGRKASRPTTLALRGNTPPWCALTRGSLQPALGTHRRPTQPYGESLPERSGIRCPSPTEKRKWCVNHKFACRKGFSTASAPHSPTGAARAPVMISALAISMSFAPMLAPVRTSGLNRSGGARRPSPKAYSVFAVRQREDRPFASLQARRPLPKSCGLLCFDP